jgi:hypothetical protein
VTSGEPVRQKTNQRSAWRNVKRYAPSKWIRLLVPLLLLLLLLGLVSTVVFVIISSFG